MRRAVAHLPSPAGRKDLLDHITLAHDERRLRRKLLRCAGGTEVMVDFPQTITLDHDGALELDDGGLIGIRAASEPLYQVKARDAAHLVRLAWHIGNRHTPAQLDSGRILIRRDHVLKAMLIGLGAVISVTDEPFFAEHGAYHSHGEHNHALLAR
jgi:urease accessory protein